MILSFLKYILIRWRLSAMYIASRDSPEGPSPVTSAPTWRAARQGLLPNFKQSLIKGYATYSPIPATSQSAESRGEELHAPLCVSMSVTIAGSRVGCVATVAPPSLAQNATNDGHLLSYILTYRNYYIVLSRVFSRGGASELAAKSRVVFEERHAK